MRYRVAVISILAALGTVPGAGQTSAPFYNVDKEVRIEATVREIRLEPRYKGTAPFLVLRVEESGSAKAFHVEIAPSWFFDQDVHGGEKVTVVGSVAEAAGAPPTIIARELKLRGETYQLRDKHGFPNWQGGPKRNRGQRRFGAS